MGCLALDPAGSHHAAVDRREIAVIVLGLVLMLIGFLTKIAILWSVGIVVALVGLVLLLLGATGREIGGRRHYY